MREGIVLKLPCPICGLRLHLVQDWRHYAECLCCGVGREHG